MTLTQDNSRERGAISILIAVALVILLGAAAMAIDLGYGLVVKSELQNAADTGTLAGTRELALVYKADPSGNWWGEKQLSGGEIAQITNKINEYTLKNKAGGTAISVPTSDIVFGRYNKDTGEIEPTNPAYTGVMAIKVKTRRDATSNGVVPMGLGRVLGTNSLSINAEAGSSLSVLKKAPAGKLGIPIALSEFWFTAKDAPCKDHDKAGHGIRLYPTGPQSGETVTNAKSCAGWHTYEDNPSNASKLRNIIDGQAAGTYVSPATEAGVTYFNFTGGVVSSAFSNMENLFNTYSTGTGVGNQSWETVVPIYKGADCSNPSGPIQIVGFATIWIYSVKGMPNATIDATVECNIVDWGEGGNEIDYGTLVGRPGMTE